MPGADAGDHECRGQERRGDHVREAEGEGGIEHHLPPADDVERAVAQLVPGGRLHPAVGGEDPERGDQGARRDRAGRPKVHATRDALAPEQQDAEEGRLEEERGQHFVVEQRAQHVAGAGRELAPVGAELKRHDDAGHHAHAERHGEDPGPEPGQIAMKRAAAPQPDRLQHDEPRRQPDRERREQNVERDAERELQPRQEHGIEVHAVSVRGPPTRTATTSRPDPSALLSRIGRASPVVRRLARTMEQIGAAGTVEVTLSRWGAVRPELLAPCPKGQRRLLVRRDQRVAQQAGDGHRADPARHRRDRAGDRERLGERHVADQARARHPRPARARCRRRSRSRRA